MSSPADKVNLQVQVELPKQDELKFKTACLCMHCAGNCKWGMHKTCHSGVAKGYCFDLEKDFTGADGWLFQQAQVKSLCCMESASQAQCAKSPFVLIKHAGHQFCCDVRCAIPFDDEVPMQLAIAGKVLYAPTQ